MSTPLSFNIFPLGSHEWCARRTDGLVCGYFLEQADAIRFARREARGVGTINVYGASQTEAPLRAAA